MTLPALSITRHGTMCLIVAGWVGMGGGDWECSGHAEL